MKAYCLPSCFNLVRDTLGTVTDNKALGSSEHAVKQEMSSANLFGNKWARETRRSA